MININLSEQRNPRNKVALPNGKNFTLKNAIRSTTQKNLSSDVFPSIKKVLPQMNEDLLKAAQENDLPKIVSHLRDGMDPNAMDKMGNTLVHYALKNSNKELLEVLLQYKANPDIKNQNGESPVHQVSRTSDVEMAKILFASSKNINQKNLDGDTPLHIATTSPNKEAMINELKNLNADPNISNRRGNTPLHVAIYNHDEGVSKTLLKVGANPNLVGGKRDLPIVNAISYEMPGLLKDLLQHGADPNLTHEYSKNPPLYTAISKNDIQSTKLLLEHGANPNMPISNNSSLLIHAIERKANDIAEILIKSGADLKVTNALGENVFLAAAKSGNIPMMEKLLSQGYDINLQNELDGKTALHMSVKNGHVDAVNFLISKGADLNIKDKKENTPIFESIPQIHYWRFIPKPNKNQSEIAYTLLQKGADIKQYETDNFFMAQFIDTLNVNRPEFARNFLFTRINNEWEKLDERRIDSLLNQFASMPKIEEKQIDQLLLKLLHPDINYADQTEATRHAAHLRSWNGVVKIDGKPEVESEGWWMHVYPPLKAKSLIMSLNKVNKNQVDCQKEFGESKEIVMKKIKHEIASQMSTYYSQRHQDMLNLVTDIKLHNEFKDHEISKYCKEIVKAPVGSEWAIASGFPGHAIYIGFRKMDENNVARVVYNLGAGLDQHHSNTDGLVYPHVVNKIKIDHFINESPEAKKYLKGVIDAKLGKMYDPLPPIYQDISSLGGEVVLKNIPGIPQKRQLVGNCVLKNNNASARNRMKNDRLFNWTKKEEQKFADEMSKIEKKIIEQKEKEKDILSFNYVIKMYNRSNNIDSAINNLVTFLEKRSTSNPEVANNLRDVERIAFYLQNMDEKKLDEFMLQRGALKMIKDMADQRYCDTLYQVINRYRNNDTLKNLYVSTFNRPFGKY